MNAEWPSSYSDYSRNTLWLTEAGLTEGVDSYVHARVPLGKPTLTRSPQFTNVKECLEPVLLSGKIPALRQFPNGMVGGLLLEVLDHRLVERVPC